QAWTGSSGIARPRRLPASRQKSGLLMRGRYGRPSGRGRRAGSLAEGSRGDGGGAAPLRGGAEGEADAAREELVAARGGVGGELVEARRRADDAG
ncbi:unnamed protein product, partial [Ectocarpus sp. 8 AP-2014]